MQILVTGGAGYIGSHCVRHLLACGHRVVVVDNLSVGHRAAVPADCLIVADLADLDRLDQLCIARSFDAVMHFAADAAVGESVVNPAKYYRNNVVNAFGLLDLVRRRGIPKFLFSSTCATYGLPETMPITEATPQRPINPYGHSKLMFERMLIDYAAAYGLGVTALRYFNASGAAADGSLGEDHTPETHLIPLVLQVALGQRPNIRVFGTDYPTPDGTCIRDYIHVEDLATAHELALQAARPGSFSAFNVGTGNGYSVREVIRTVEDVTGRSIAVVEADRRDGDPPTLVAAADKIRDELGWTPKYPELRPIVESAWRWHRAHPKGYAGL